MTRTIAIASGKGGVGKTSISVNLSLHLAAQGYKTCLFDADLGLANINILLALHPKLTVEDMILRGKSIEEIILKDCHGIDIIPGSSGVEIMADLDEHQLGSLVQGFSALDSYDFLLFDTSAGVSRQVIAFCLAVNEVVLIITPEPTSLTDAYALLKILIRNGFEGKAKIVVNQCRTHEIAKSAYSKFRMAVKKHLQTEVIPLGFIYEDEKVPSAVSVQQPFILQHPKATASVCLKHIAKNLLENKPENLEVSGATSFWNKCLELMRSPLSLEGFKKKQASGTDAGVYLNPEAAASEPETVEAQEEPERQAIREEAVPSPEKPEEQQPVSPEPVVASVHETPVISEAVLPEGGEVLPLLQELVQAVSSATQELSLMRQSMEKGGRNSAEEDMGLVGRWQSQDSDVIHLDYGTWVSRFKRKKS